MHEDRGFAVDQVCDVRKLTLRDPGINQVKGRGVKADNEELDAFQSTSRQVLAELGATDQDGAPFGMSLIL